MAFSAPFKCNSIGKRQRHFGYHEKTRIFKLWIFISIPQNKEFAAEGVKESKYIIEHIALLCFSCETHLILDL